MRVRPEAITQDQVCVLAIRSDEGWAKTKPETFYTLYCFAVFGGLLMGISVVYPLNFIYLCSNMKCKPKTNKD